MREPVFSTLCLLEHVVSACLVTRLAGDVAADLHLDGRAGRPTIYTLPAMHRADIATSAQQPPAAPILELIS